MLMVVFPPPGPVVVVPNQWFAYDVVRGWVEGAGLSHGQESERYFSIGQARDLIGAAFAIEHDEGWNPPVRLADQTRPFTGRWKRIALRGYGWLRARLPISMAYVFVFVGLHAPADGLPLDDGSVDAIVSSFVYQLVPDRNAAFREAYRVLRPGGAIAIVTWLDRDGDFEPAVEFDEAVYDIEIEEPEEEPEEIRAGDFRSARSAANELRRAGFANVSARLEPLEYGWTREGYLAFKQHYDERALFSWLDRSTADRLLERVRERFLVTRVLEDELALMATLLGATVHTQ